MPAKKPIEKKECRVVEDEILQKTSTRNPESFPSPPEYQQEGFRINGFKSYTDNYKHLQNPKDKRTKQALKLERRYANAFFSRPKFNAIKRELFHEIKSFVDKSAVSLPVLEGNFWYYTRNEQNEEYPLHCRRPCDLKHGINTNFLEEVCVWQATHPNGEPLPRYPDEVIILDLNLLVRELDLAYIEIGDMDISFDETKIAVTLDCSGGEEIFSLFIFEIQDVNYRGWLETGASDAQKAWAHSLSETDTSIYTSMPSPRSNISSPASPLWGTWRALKKRVLDGRSGMTSGASSSFANLTSDASPMPRHRFLQRIELFDLTGDVLWVNPTCLMYSVQDEKLRSHQIVFHDTEIDPSDPNATWICYEEEEEAFWLSSLGFTADDRYLVFCSSSTEASKWFICPAESHPVISETGANGDRERRRGAVFKVPFFCKEMERLERHARQSITEHKETVMTAETCGSVGFWKRCAPTACFPAHGKTPIEYDLDHHDRLLGAYENSGGWIITSNARGCTNFAVFFLPDENTVLEWETVCLDPSVLNEDSVISNESEKEPKNPKMFPVEQKPPSPPIEVERIDSDTWPLLFEYDPATKVESVQCFKDFLLINVIRDASSEVLFCPIHLIWDWWARAHSCKPTPEDLSSSAATVSPSSYSPSEGHTRHSIGNFPTPLRLNQTILLSSLLRRQVSRLKMGEWVSFNLHNELQRADEQILLDFESCSATSAADNPETAADEFRFPPPTFFESLDAWNDAREAAKGGDRSPHASFPSSTLRATPLRDRSECSSIDVDFATRTFALAVSHLLFPTAHYEWWYIPPEEGRSGLRGESGSLMARLLCKEGVRGKGYNPFEYHGAVFWVPSDYAFTQSRGKDALTPISTQTPAEAVSVPVFAIWRADSFQPGENSTLLNVYGSYGESFEAEFTVERLVMLNRGFIWAYAAVRGGGELGIPWRDAGRHLQRATSVNDFISLSSFLMEVGLCAKGFLASSGSSAGGMIVCRAVNAAPHLYLTVIAGVPFVDCLTTLLDDSLPLTVTEREEFGDPTTNETAFDLIYEISPVLTIPSQVIAPNMLLSTSLNDTRVGFWEPMKLAALMRSKMIHGEDVRRAVVLMCDDTSGHDGASGRYQHIEEIAKEYAFVIDAERRERDASRNVEKFR